MESSKNTDFVVRLVGSGIKPWSVPLHALSRLMDAIQRLVQQNEEEDVEDKISSSENQDQPFALDATNVLRLVGIRASSAGYAISTPFRESALSTLALTGKAIENPSESEWSGATISSLKDVSEIAKSLGVRVEIRKPNDGGKLGDVIAKITPTTYAEVEDAAFVTGETSLFGSIERIGGASAARCAIRVSDESKLVYCSVASEDLAKNLGAFLYQSVSIHGRAKWLRANWRICSFEIMSFDPPKTGSFREALDGIWKAGGKAWDDIADPDAFIAEMRGA